MELVKIDATEIAESLRSIDSPEFKEWIWKEWRRGELSLIVQGLITAKKATGVADAIDYVATQFAKEIKNIIGNKTTLGDLQNNRRLDPATRKLDELLNGKTPKYYDRTRYYGVKGHVVIPKLFSGKLIHPSYYLTHLKTERGLTWVDTEYRELVGGIEDPVSEKFISSLKKKALSLVRLSHPVTKKMRKASALVGQIEDYLVKIEIEMETNKYPRYSKNYTGLKKCLVKVFGDELREILDRLFDDDYLTFLTCLTWAQATTFYSYFDQPLVLFEEVSVFDFGYDIGAGRIDALALYRVKGKRLTKSQLNTIRGIKARTQNSLRRFSLGQIIRELVIHFGEDIELRIYDWKFAVGDGPSGMRKKQSINIIDSSKIQLEPLFEHIKQMKRYISVAYLSYAIATGKDVEHQHDIASIYNNVNFRINGVLLYFTPDQSPVPYSFSLAKEEMINTLREQLFANYRKAHKQAKRRKITSQVVKHTLKLVQGEGIALENVSKNPPGHQYTLFNLERSFSSFAANYTEPVFKDPFNIIEVVGKEKGGADIHEMHLNTLLAAIEDGRVTADPNFNMVNGGFISCIVTPENTPSMSLSFQKHFFKCFSCGISGTFAESSITDEMREMIATMPSFKRHRETERTVIPPRHREIMEAAQVLLQAAFKGSDGQRYLEGTLKHERGLDAEQSFAQGVGYGTHDLIIGLLDQGYRYDELIYYGFISLSPKLTQDDYLSLALLRWGLTVDEIGVVQKKQLKPGQPAEIVPCFPYSILERRITYPLEIGGAIDSFYGRSVDVNSTKSMYHRKLPNGAHQLPHGAYNMAQAMRDAAAHNSPILVTEAPIDADTFMQISDIKYATGIVGVSNHILIELLSDFQGDIIIALDWDKKDPINPEKGETGQKNTVKVAAMLREYGFRGKIYDFTKLFVEKHFIEKGLEVTYKDANRYWTENRKTISIMDLIKDAPNL